MVCKTHSFAVLVVWGETDRILEIDLQYTTTPECGTHPVSLRGPFVAVTFILTTTANQCYIVLIQWCRIVVTNPLARTAMQ